MDRCSNSGESGQRREGVRRERGSRRKIKACEKVEMSPNIVFFQFVAPESRKVGSLKRWVQSHLVGGEIKNCTRLWRQAHFEVIMRLKFGVLLDVEMLKKFMPLWREAHVEVKT